MRYWLVGALYAADDWLWRIYAKMTIGFERLSASLLRLARRFEHECPTD